MQRGNLPDWIRYHGPYHGKDQVDGMTWRKELRIDMPSEIQETSQSMYSVGVRSSRRKNVVGNK